MKIRYLGSNSTACDLYRAGFPFDTLAKKGEDVGFVDKDIEYGVNTKTNEIVGLNIEADVIIVPRPVSEVQYTLVKAAKAAGAAVVVEMDDELDSVHKDNRAYEFITPGIKWLYKSLEECHLITVSTERLAEKYHPDKAVVIPNYVPDIVYEHDVADFEDKWGIGWTGSLGVHPDDLYQLGDSIRRMHRKHGIDFRHIGDGNLAPIIRTKYLSYGYLAYDQYLLGIDSFAIGVVPLAPTDFNDSKSTLKGLEMSALGVPFVASPTREYLRLNKQHGLGIIANNPYEWYVEMRRLLDDSYRREQSEMHREVAANWTYQYNDWRWMEAWQQAIDWKDGK